MASKFTSNNPFPGFGQIFLVSPTMTGFHADLNLRPDADSFALARGECVPGEALLAEWDSGPGTPTEVVTTTWAVPMLVGPRFQKTLLELRATGWSTFPVVLKDRQKHVVRGYSGLSITGRCGPLENQRSVRFEKKTAGGHTHAWLGYYFAEASWDGSDVFTTSDSGAQIFVLERVKTALEANGIPDLSFTALDEVERDAVTFASDERLARRQ